MKKRNINLFPAGDTIPTTISAENRQIKRTKKCPPAPRKTFKTRDEIIFRLERAAAEYYEATENFMPKLDHLSFRLNTNKGAPLSQPTIRKLKFIVS